MASAAEALEAALREAGEPERAQGAKAYLKSDLTHYGVRVPMIHRLARQAGRDAGRSEHLQTVVELWDNPAAYPVFERRLLAADLLSVRVDMLVPADLPMVERFCREARTWAIIDTLAPRVVGPLATEYPEEVVPALDAWACDEDFWMRRTALLSPLVPLRAGGGDWERFTRHADPLLEDREFFVAKAIGWVLRDTGRRRPEMVRQWVEPRITRMQGVTVREALKPFPAEVQQRLRAKRSRSAATTRST
jgi:3-methyladenine DNA glycosylase AlkD